MNSGRSAHGAVDVDRAITWPRDIRRYAEEIANEIRGRSRYVSDMVASPGVGDEFRSLFVGRLLLAYHATRLLDHEVEMIRSQGLRVLEEGLILERIEKACSLGHISVAECDRLKAGNVFGERESRGRAGHVRISGPNEMRSLLFTAVRCRPSEPVFSLTCNSHR